MGKEEDHLKRFPSPKYLRPSGDKWDIIKLNNLHTYEITTITSIQKEEAM